MAESELSPFLSRSQEGFLLRAHAGGSNVWASKRGNEAKSASDIVRWMSRWEEEVEDDDGRSSCNRCSIKLETYKRLAGEPDTSIAPAPVVSPWHRRVQWESLRSAVWVRLH